MDEDLKPRSLKEFLGQKIALVFFIGAFTSTCTKGVCEFRDSMSRLIDLKAQVIGIDVTVPVSNKSFSEKNRLPFPVLSDHKREILATYGLECPDFGGLEAVSNVCCWGKGCYPVAKRSIFILDENGIVRYRWILDDPAVEPSYEEIQKALEQIS
jgi:glutaredoxin-dependent peroxiredoxin